MLINQHITGDINIQLSFLLNFVVAYYLYNHNAKARKIIMVFMGIVMIIQFLAFIYLTINGLPEGAKTMLWGMEISNIINSKFIPVMFLLSMSIPAVPFFLLRSKQAVSEFSNVQESEIIES